MLVLSHGGHKKTSSFVHSFTRSLVHSFTSLLLWTCVVARSASVERSASRCCWPARGLDAQCGVLSPATDRDGPCSPADRDEPLPRDESRRRCRLRSLFFVTRTVRTQERTLLTPIPACFAQQEGSPNAHPRGGTHFARRGLRITLRKRSPSAAF